MIEITEQKEQKKINTKTKEKTTTTMAQVTPIYIITFSRKRYSATNFLLRFLTTVLGRSNSNCARH